VDSFIQKHDAGASLIAKMLPCFSIISEFSPDEFWIYRSSYFSDLPLKDRNVQSEVVVSGNDELERRIKLLEKPNSSSELVELGFLCEIAAVDDNVGALKRLEIWRQFLGMRVGEYEKPCFDTTDGRSRFLHVDICYR
jgi:hypothetical protein